jgi:hypothetical protein
MQDKRRVWRVKDKTYYEYYVPGGGKDFLNLYDRVIFPGLLRVFIISRKRLKQKKQPTNRILLTGILSG